MHDAHRLVRAGAIAVAAFAIAGAIGACAGGAASTAPTGGSTTREPVSTAALHWQVSGTLPRGVANVGWAQCISAQKCTVTASAPGGNGAMIFETTDGGAAWKAASAIPGKVSFTGLSCGPSAACVAVAFSPAPFSTTVLRSADSGASWSVAGVEMGDFLAAVSCASSQACIAVGSVNPATKPPGSSDATAIASGDGGATWGTSPFPGAVVAPLLDVSCPSTRHCVAVGPGRVVLTTDSGGATWTYTKAPQGADILTQVACCSPATCVAAGVQQSPRQEVALTTSDGGTTWNAATVPDNLRSGLVLSAFSCSSASWCVAVGKRTDAAVLLVSNDGGLTCTAAKLPTGVAALVAVSCPT